MRLFTIGDSISQGFMSLAAARTELSFSTLIARCLGELPGVNYAVPFWGAGGIPLNIERILRNLQRHYGSDIKGPLEWAAAVVSINQMLDEVEDYYERGPGNIALPQAGTTPWFPNVSVAGFTIADAWLVTPEWCHDRIASTESEVALFSEARDGFFALPNRRFERTAHAVLNPSRDPRFNEFSALEWLKFHVEREDGDGVENVILWLGPNNALGTVVRLKVEDTGKAADWQQIRTKVEERNKYNLWSEEHFGEEYEELLTRVNKILTASTATRKKCRVFVGTVPAVTIAPLAKGVGEPSEEDDPFGVLPKARYYQYYTYVLFDIDYARRSHRLTRDEALMIDRRIAKYNETIKSLVQKFNSANKEVNAGVEYVVVDIAKQLLQLAFRRNNGQPTYKLPEPLKKRAEAMRRPEPNTIYYHADRQSVMLQGGIFSLDGVHPSAIGQGLLAHEFIKCMREAGVDVPGDLDWSAIVASDSLFTNPIALMPELYDNPKLAEGILDLLSLP
jgi:hypothetical protein